MIVTGWQNRRINKADYAGKIIEQSDKRVDQALADKDRALAERDDARSDAKGQRKAKQEWRDKFFTEQKAHHETQLTLKDTSAKLAEADWHRCEQNGCKERIPPRKREGKK